MPDAELFDIPEVPAPQSRCDLLISLGLAGKLTTKEQVAIANELRIYRNMAVALDGLVHDWIKRLEEAGIEL